MNGNLHTAKFTDTDAPNIIELKNISQVYDGNKIVIQDLNLLIEKRENHQFIVILGQSGCGKSTLLRYVAGLQKPTSGEVFLNGQPRSENDVVSMVFQRYSSPPWMTALENVMLPLILKGVPKKQAKEEAMQMVKAMGLEGHEQKFAQEPLLSGGQLQRVAIARSLITNAGIILMDEPFGALDLNTRLDMQLLLAEIYEKLKPTIIFVTHAIDEAVFLGDEVWIMDANPGRIIRRIDIDLPLHRDRMTKRESRFLELVYEVEDAIEKLRNAS